MTNERSQSEKFKQMAREVGADQDEKRLEERLKKVATPKQPGPAKNVGDDSPNPLPDDPSADGGEGGGDPGRA